jgi:hypothetical protein
MSAPFRLRVRGRSGHASMPGIADNALVKAAPLIPRSGAYKPEQELIPEVEALLETVTASARPRRRCARAGARSRAAARGDGRAAAVDDAVADNGERVAEAERHSRDLRRRRRQPAAARDDDRTSSRRSCAGSSVWATTS